MKKQIQIILTLICVAVTVNGQVPVITSFSPSSGPVGTLITIIGSNLANIPQPPTPIVQIGNSECLIISNTATTIKAVVMPGAQTGPISILTKNGSTSSTSSFNVTTKLVPNKLDSIRYVGSGSIGNSAQGASVCISADGSTMAIGGSADNIGDGAVWVFHKNGISWIEQAKLVGTGAIGKSYQGISVQLSADGNTLAVLGYNDNARNGAVWIFNRNGTQWTQEVKLVGTVEQGYVSNYNIALSYDGKSLLVGRYLASSSNVISKLGVFNKKISGWLEDTVLTDTSDLGYCEFTMSGDGKVIATLTGDGERIKVFNKIDSNWNLSKRMNTFINSEFHQTLLQSNIALNIDGSVLAFTFNRASIYEDSIFAYISRKSGTNWNREVGVFWTNSNINLTSDGHIGNRISLNSDGTSLFAIEPNDIIYSSGLKLRRYLKQSGLWKLHSQDNITSAGDYTPWSNQVFYSGIRSFDVTPDGKTAVIGDWLNNQTFVFANTSSLNVEKSAISLTGCIQNGSLPYELAFSSANTNSNVTVSVPSGFQISKGKYTGYSSSIQLVPEDGQICQTILNLKLTGTTGGTFSGNINFFSAASSTVSIPISGIVTGAKVLNNSISGKQDICVGTKPVMLSGTIPTGGNGSYVYSWIISTDSNKYSPTGGLGDTTNLTPNTLFNDSWYRRVVISGGCIDTTSAIKVNTHNYPTARFISMSSDTQCLIGNRYLFIDSSSIESGLLRRNWIYSDGAKDTIFRTNRVFNSKGKQTVKLVSVSEYGCRDTVIKEFYILESPSAGAIAGLASNLVIAQPYLYNINQQNGLNYNWLVKNAAIVSGQGTNAITVQWISNGVGSLKCVVTNSLGCTDTASLIVGIGSAPSIASFTPTSAITGQTVTINGVNLTGATAVKFGGVNAQSFSVVSANRIDAIVGLGSSGALNVETPNGNASLAGFTFLGSTGISESVVKNSVIIYPNPASTILNIEFNKPGNYVVKLTNTIGQTYTKNTTTGVIDVSGLANGVYTLSIYDNDNKLISINKVSVIK